MVTANLVRADSGLALFTVQQGASGAGDILDAVDKVAKGMRSRIGESLRSIAQAPSLERATTSSLAALREYSRALEAGDLRGDWEQGLVHLRVALKEDSTFAMAWRKLAVYQANRLGGLRSDVFFASERAYRFRERLPDQERFEVEAYYTRLLGTRPGAEFYAEHQDVLSQNNRVIELNELGEYAAAESVAIANIARDQAAGRRSIIQLRNNLVFVQANQGKREEVGRALVEFQRDFPGTLALANVEFWVASANGLDSVASTIGRAKRSSLRSARVNATNGDANVAAARGQLRQAAQLRRAAMAVADSGKIVLNLGGFAAFDAVIGATLRGAPAAGLRVVDSLAARLVKSGSWLDRSDLAVATAYAQLGQTDRAKALVSEFERSATREERLMEWGVWQGALGEIALTEGRTDEAIAAFKRSAHSDTGKVVSAYNGLTALRLARAYDKAGQADSALRYFERLTAPEMLGGQVTWLPQALALTPRRLGELYEAKGDITNAIKHYQAFVTLWKDADPELQPQVAEIKARVARLFAAEAKKR
jgi:tetratricopeptide (TPR) repeat protein